MIDLPPQPAGRALLLRAGLSSVLFAWMGIVLAVFAANALWLARTDPTTGTSYLGALLADGAVVPDGDYRLRFTGVALTDDTPVANERLVRVDTTPPVPQILAIEPPVFTPEMDSASTVLRVRIRVTGASLGDSLAASLRTTKPLALRLVDDFVGDGDYVAKCDSCATPRTRVPDGTYDIQVTGSDRAGNEAQATAQVDKDIVGPSMRLAHPSTAAEIHVQHADSLVGTAWDRHGVARVDLEIASVADTLSRLARRLRRSSASRDLSSERRSAVVTASSRVPTRKSGTATASTPGAATEGGIGVRSRSAAADRTGPEASMLAARRPEGAARASASRSNEEAVRAGPASLRTSAGAGSAASTLATLATAATDPAVPAAGRGSRLASGRTGTASERAAAALSRSLWARARSVLRALHVAARATREAARRRARTSSIRAESVHRAASPA